MNHYVWLKEDEVIERIRSFQHSPNLVALDHFPSHQQDWDFQGISSSRENKKNIPIRKLMTFKLIMNCPLASRLSGRKAH